MVTSRRLFTYGADGELAKLEIDQGGDGSVDGVTTYVREPEGDGVKQTSTSSTGRVEVLLINADGVPYESRVDADGDGVLEEIVTATYDESGHKVLSVTDTGADGRIDERRIYENDAHGNVLKKEVDRGDDGTFEEVTEWTYDDQGNVLTEAVDADADGVVDSETTYDYACWQ